MRVARPVGESGNNSSDPGRKVGHDASGATTYCRR